MIQTLMLMTILAFPQVSMSIAKVESGINAKAVGKAGEKGAFQVREKYWGKVPKTLKDQMEQHNKILLELLEANNHNINKAVMSYNGTGKRANRYLCKVIRRSFESELLGV